MLHHPCGHAEHVTQRWQRTRVAVLLVGALPIGWTGCRAEAPSADAHALLLVSASRRAGEHGHARAAFLLGAHAWRKGADHGPAVRREVLSALHRARERLGVARRSFAAEDAVALALDESRLAAATGDGHVLVWALDDASAPVRAGLDCAPESLALLRGAQVLVQCPNEAVVVGADARVRARWAATDFPAAISPDGRLIATLTPERVSVREAANLREVAAIDEPELSAVAFGSDGRCLYTGTRSGTLRRWTSETPRAPDAEWELDGTIIGVFAYEPCEPPWVVVDRGAEVTVERAGAGFPVARARSGSAVHFSPTRVLIADVAGRRVSVHMLGGAPNEALHLSPSSHVTRAALARDVALIVDRAGRVRLFGAARTPHPVVTSGIGGARTLGVLEQAPRAVALSADARRVAVATERSIELWDASRSHFGWWPVPHVRALRFDAAGHAIAQSAVHGVVRLEADGRRVLVTTDPNARALALLGDEVVVSTPDGARAFSSRTVAIPRSAGRWIGMVGLGDSLLAMTSDGLAHVWTATDREPHVARLPADHYQSLEAHPGASSALALGRRGSLRLAWRDGALHHEPAAAIDGHPCAPAPRPPASMRPSPVDSCWSGTPTARSCAFRPASIPSSARPPSAPTASTSRRSARPARWCGRPRRPARRSSSPLATR